MAATNIIRTILAAAAAVNPTAAGVRAGDTVIDQAAGEVRQVGLTTLGVRYLRADPLTGLTAQGFGLVVLNAPTVTGPAPQTIRVVGTVSRLNGQVPAGPALIFVAVTGPGGGADPTTIVVNTGRAVAIVAAAANLVAGSAQFWIMTDGAGAYSFDIAAGGLGAGTLTMSTNWDVIDAAAVTF